MQRSPAQRYTDEFDTVLAALGDGFCVCEMIVDAKGAPVDYRFLAVNKHFEEMTGLKDATGRTALELVPDLEWHWIETYARAGLGRETLKFQLGSVAMGRMFDVYAAPIWQHGQFSIVFRDITALKRAEEGRENALQHAQRLLVELNHRVMNSLSMISSIVSIEVRQLADEAGRQAMNNVRTRLKAVADLYKTLNASSSVDRVKADSYLNEILKSVTEAVTADRQIRIMAEVAPIDLSTRAAVPVGLIVNELITNSLKYAFAPGQAGTIQVGLRVDGDQLALVVADDGRGIDPAARSGSGIGRQLVDAFIQQIGGQIETQSGAGGTVVTIRFADQKAV